MSVKQRDWFKYKSFITVADVLAIGACASGVSGFVLSPDNPIPKSIAGEWKTIKPKLQPEASYWLQIASGSFVEEKNRYGDPERHYPDGSGEGILNVSTENPRPNDPSRSLRGINTEALSLSPYLTWLQDTYGSILAEPDFYME